jgi:hypothetical protein
MDDPRVAELGRIERGLREQNKNGIGLYSSWIIWRRYSAAELAQARLLLFQFKAWFEPEGERCGTVYDYSAACKYCGAGRIQVSPLTLVASSIPRKDLAATIARDEWVVSERLARAMHEARVTGAQVDEVRYAENGRAKRKFYQLRIISPPVTVLPPTRFSVDPFDTIASEDVCPLGHLAQGIPVSEVSVSASSWSGSDIVRTDIFGGRRVGVIVPSPFVLISQRFARLLKEGGFKGYALEVAHLV